MLDADVFDERIRRHEARAQRLDQVGVRRHHHVAAAAGRWAGAGGRSWCRSRRRIRVEVQHRGVAAQLARIGMRSRPAFVLADDLHAVVVEMRRRRASLRPTGACCRSTLRTQASRCASSSGSRAGIARMPGQPRACTDSLRSSRSAPGSARAPRRRRAGRRRAASSRGLRSACDTGRMVGRAGTSVRIA